MALSVSPLKIFYCVIYYLVPPGLPAFCSPDTLRKASWSLHMEAFGANQPRPGPLDPMRILPNLAKCS